MKAETDNIGAKIVATAYKEVGYTEYPADSNKTKFGKWFGMDGVKWCGIFVSWVYAMAGKPLGNVGFLKGFAGTQYAFAYYKKKGKIVTTPQQGDIVFFDWNNDGRIDHTGIFVADINGKIFTSVEGNTSAKNDSNGGSVMERARSYKYAKFVRP